MKMADEMKFRKEDFGRPKEKIIIIKKPNNLYTIFDVFFFAGFFEKKEQQIITLNYTVGL